MKPIVFDFPVPPSLNQLWRVGKGHVYKNPKHTAWLKEFWMAWLLVKPKRFKTIDSPVNIKLLVCPKRKRDVDNTAKAVLDALQAMRVLGNDSQVCKLTSELVDKERAPLGCRIKINATPA